MKRLLAVVTAGVLVFGLAVPVFADSTGYEGQPGGQSNGGGNHGGGSGGNGPSGYEGQPGGQGGGN